MPRPSAKPTALTSISFRTRGLIDGFLDMMLAERNAATNTRQAYRRDLDDAATFMAKEQRDLADASEDDVRLYLRSMGRMAAKTQARRLSSLRQFFQYLCSEGHRKADPTRAIDSPKLGKSLPKYLSEAEVGRLLEVVAHMTGAEGARLRAMLELLYAAGLRVSELVSLPVTALRFDTSIVQVKGKGGKERLIPFGEPAAAALQNWLPLRKQELGDAARACPFVFPTRNPHKHITRQRFFQLIKELALAAKIDPARLSPHVVRHAFATHLIEHGADLRSVQTMLGHADIATTQIYTHVASDRLGKMVGAHHPLAKPAAIRKKKG